MTTQNNLNKSLPIKQISERQNKLNNYVNNSADSNVPHEVFIDRTIYKFKIILVGNSSVGKTSLINRYMGFGFEENYPCTVNADFKIKSLTIDEITGAELTVWDTCGQEKYKALTRQYFKDAHGVILLYDVTNEDSFKGLNSWLTEIRNNSNKDVSIVLVGNKIDLDDRKITKEIASEFAIKNGLFYYETSSKDGINIDVPFENLAKDLVKKIKEYADSDPNETVEQKLERIKERNIIERKREKEVKCC